MSQNSIYLRLYPIQRNLCVTYEDLCKTPEATIFKILAFLKLKPKSTLDYKSLIQPRPVNLLPEVKRKYDEIYQKLQPYFIYNSID